MLFNSTLYKFSVTIESQRDIIVMYNFGKWILLLTICLSIIVPGCGKSNEKEARKLIESARKYMSQNKPEPALTDYRKAIQLDPNNDIALFETAEVNIVIGRLETAIRFYNLASKADPNNIMPRLRLAQIYLQTGQLFSARNEIKKVLELSPNSVDAHHILSGVQIQERDLDAAIDTLQKASKLNNENATTQIGLARLYLKKNNIDEAKDAFLKAMVIDPASRDAYMGLIRIYAFETKFDEIEELFRGIVKSPGKKAQKYTDFAKFYEGRKNINAAEQKYQQAILESPENVLPHINLAEFYSRQGFKDKAFKTMENALSKNPKSLPVMTAFAQVYLHFGMIDEALKMADNVLQVNNNYVNALFVKGKILITQSKFKQALDYFDKVIAINRIDAEAYYYRGICIKEKGATDRPEQELFRAAQGMLDEADEFEKNQVKGNYLAALTVDPELIDARIRLAEIYIKENNVKKAREQLKEIFRRKAPDNKIMTLISAIHILEGNEAEAEKIYLSLIQQQPDYNPAYIRLGFLYRSKGYTQEALTYFKKAFEKDPRQIKLVKIMADMLIKEKKFQKALELTEALSLNADTKEAAYFTNIKGEILLKKGSKNLALEHFKQSIKLKPDYIVPHMHLAKYYSANGMKETALEHYSAVEKVKPGYVPALMSMAVIYEIQKEFVKAENYYRKVLAVQPAHPDAANNLAFLLTENPGTLEEAFRLAKIATGIKHKDPNVLDTIGWIYYQKGNYLRALSDLQESYNLNPDNPLTAYHLGMVYYRTKEFEKAKKYIKKALAINPSFRGADLARKMLD